VTAEPNSDLRPLRPTDVLLAILLLLVVVAGCLALFFRPYYQLFVQEPDSYTYVGTGVAGRPIYNRLSQRRRIARTWYTPSWLLEVTLPSGEIVEATTPSMPRRGEKLCIIRRSSGPVAASEYHAFRLVAGGALPDACEGT
jgi:hypothetical protein